MIQCVVYNSSHEPLSVVSAERALILHLDGRAQILEKHPTKRFRSQHDEFPAPTKIVLKKYRHVGRNYYGEAVKNQRNLFVRDGYCCVYCERHIIDLRRKEYLTRDHVFPISRGGEDIWENIVTSCSTCNHRKDDRTPSEADMPIKGPKPRAPRVAEIMMKRAMRLERRRELVEV